MGDDLNVIEELGQLDPDDPMVDLQNYEELEDMKLQIMTKR